MNEENHDEEFEQESPPDVPENFRCGFIALAGIPNAGKSTLINRLLGQKVVITSHHPQTTRHRVGGILNEEGHQAILLDVPGMPESQDAFNLALSDCAQEAVRDADWVLHMRTAASLGSNADRGVVDFLRRIRKPIWLVWNKTDIKPSPPEVLPPELDLPYDRVFAISAQKGTGVDLLRREILSALPLSHPHYPLDDVSDRDLRFIASEFVREKAFLFLREEIPHGLVTETETFEEVPGRATHIRVAIQTDRDAHKRIIIGAGGAMLKKIGSAARRDLEELMGGPVYLELWVRVKPKWRTDPSELQRHGIQQPRRRGRG